MNILTQLLTTFCVACVFIGALYIVCPDMEMGKSVKYLLSLVFLITVITATGFTVKKADINFEMPQYEISETERLDTAAAEYAYAYVLRANDINFSKITVCTDKIADGSIVISKVIICSDCEKARILQALGDAAKNFEVEIINE